MHTVHALPKPPRITAGRSTAFVPLNRPTSRPSTLRALPALNGQCLWYDVECPTPPKAMLVVCHRVEGCFRPVARTVLEAGAPAEPGLCRCEEEPAPEPPAVMKLLPNGAAASAPPAAAADPCDPVPARRLFSGVSRAGCRSSSPLPPQALPATGDSSDDRRLSLPSAPPPAPPPGCPAKGMSTRGWPGVGPRPR
jgi:hypothetical protein